MDLTVLEQLFTVEGLNTLVNASSLVLLRLAIKELRTLIGAVGETRRTISNVASRTEGVSDDG